MELTAFKTIPEELIRHIMDYARPTYPYLEELKLAQNEVYARHKYPYFFYLIKSLTHARMFRNYRIYGKYKEIYGNWRLYEVMEDIIWWYGLDEEMEIFPFQNTIKGKLPHIKN